jgi:hypothetical protein
MCYRIGTVFITVVNTVNIIADNIISTDIQWIFIYVTGLPHL